MTRRMGTFIYRLGSLIAVLAIGGAVVWNISAFNQRQQIRANFESQFTKELGYIFLEEKIANRPRSSELPTVLAEQLKKSRASTENLRQSITFGGALFIFGLIAYGLGWAARSASRKPE